MGKKVMLSGTASGKSAARANTGDDLNKRMADLWVTGFLTENPDVVDRFRPYLADFLENDVIPEVDLSDTSWDLWEMQVNFSISQEQVFQAAMDYIMLTDVLDQMAQIQSLLDRTEEV